MLIVNDTQTLSRLEVHGGRPDTEQSSFTVSSPTLTVTAPDQTTSTPSVTVAPVGASFEHVLYANYTATEAGQYRFAWRYMLSDGETYDRVEVHFASWTDIGTLIRRRLQETKVSMPDCDFETEVAYVVRTIVDRYVLLQQNNGYNGLMGLDQDRFDQAVGLMVALKLRPGRAKKAPLGEVQSVKLSQSNEYVFANAVRAGKPLEQQWLEEALLALGRVTLIQQAYASAASSFSPFVVNGPTRNSMSQGGIETLLSGVIRLLTDDWTLVVDGEGQLGDLAP